LSSTLLCKVGNSAADIATFSLARSMRIKVPAFCVRNWTRY